VPLVEVVERDVELIDAGIPERGARSADNIAPCVINVTYLRLMDRSTSATKSSRSRRSVGSPPVKVTSIGLKKRAASEKLLSSMARVDGSVFQ